MSVPDGVVPWFKRANAYWESVCRYCRRPSAKTCNILEDLAAVLAHVIEFGEIFLDGFDVLARADEIMRPKMVDYAGDEDFAANFKRSAGRAGLTPAKVWAVFASKHWDAVSAYVLRGKTESEAIEDRLADVVNYCQLLAGMVVERTA